MEMGHRDLSLLRSRYMMPSSRLNAARFWRALKDRTQIPPPTARGYERVHIQHVNTAAELKEAATCRKI